MVMLGNEAVNTRKRIQKLETTVLCGLFARKHMFLISLIVYSRWHCLHTKSRCGSKISFMSPASNLNKFMKFLFEMLLVLIANCSF